MKTKMNKKLVGMLTLAGVLVVMLSTFAVAFGVASPYWNEKPLVIYPGETVTVELSLQNVAGGEDIILRAELVEGDEIASLSDRVLDYDVPTGSTGVPVRLRVTVPEGTEAGTSYGVGVSFTEVSDGDGGTVKLTGKVGKSFSVIAGGEPTPEPEAPEGGFSPLLIAIIIAAAIAVVYFSMRRS